MWIWDGLMSLLRGSDCTVNCCVSWLHVAQVTLLIDLYVDLQLSK